MDLEKMKTGAGSQQPWINPALFRALPITIKPASQLLWSAATFLLALPSDLLVRVGACICPPALSALICLRAAAVSTVSSIPIRYPSSCLDSTLP